MFMTAVIRPADPSDRAEYPDAHEVRLITVDGRPVRSVGVWAQKRQAQDIADKLNQWSGSQVR